MEDQAWHRCKQIKMTLTVLTSAPDFSECFLFFHKQPANIECSPETCGEHERVSDMFKRNLKCICIRAWTHSQHWSVNSIASNTINCLCLEFLCFVVFWSSSETIKTKLSLSGIEILDLKELSLLLIYILEGMDAASNNFFVIWYHITFTENDKRWYW